MEVGVWRDETVAWRAIVTRLVRDGDGEAAGCLHHPDVGPIDVVYGGADGGLRHILEKHPEVVKNLPAHLSAMTLVSRSANRIVLQSIDHRAVIRLTYDDLDKTWLLTAYERRQQGGGRTDSSDPSDRAGSPDPLAGVDMGVGVRMVKRRGPARTLVIQVVSDGRAGIENQALGLAEAVERITPADITVKRVRWRPLFDKLPVRLKNPAMLDPTYDDPFPVGDQLWPDLWIAAGRATLPLSLAARGRSGGRTFVVQTQDPRLNPARFDMVVAPDHDDLQGDNVFRIIGSPHRVTPARIAETWPAFALALEPLAHPRVAVLVGGRSKAFDLTDDHAASLANRIAEAIEAANGSLMLTFSRRTPKDARKVIAERLAYLPGLIWDGEGANPLFAFLHAADHILVTEDSANMAAEAASTGKPVHILPMVTLRPAGKFERLHAALRAHGAARPFDGALQAWTYEPLAETDRAAQAVLEAMQAR